MPTMRARIFQTLLFTATAVLLAYYAFLMVTTDGPPCGIEEPPLGGYQAAMVCDEG